MVFKLLYQFIVLIITITNSLLTLLMNFGLSDGENLEKTNSMVLINDSKETSNSRLINADIGKSLIETTTKSFENMNSSSTITRYVHVQYAGSPVTIFRETTV